MQKNNRKPQQLTQMGFDKVDPEFKQHFRSPLGKRDTPLDLIFTWSGTDGLCCSACLAGMKYGTQSKRALRICGNESLAPNHKLIFIDNQYTEYDHSVHLAAIKQWRPKYATSRDIMTLAQCKQSGAQFYSFGQIMDWAEELSQYAENVIVIPKYDCIDRIPAKFMLGYSIPTSHGGTPMPVQKFKGRRVHLLGGNWRRQLDYLNELGNDVVSIDNNHCHHISRFAFFYKPDGKECNLTEEGHPELSNPRGVALALSFGAMVYKLNELYAAGHLKMQAVEGVEYGQVSVKEIEKQIATLPSIGELGRDGYEVTRNLLKAFASETSQDAVNQFHISLPSDGPA